MNYKRAAWSGILAASRHGLYKGMAKAKRKKEGLPRWKSKGEYAEIYLPKHPRANSQGRVYAHRLVAEYHIGRLRYVCYNHSMNDVVHHIDMDKGNNKPENLRVMSNKAHREYHAYLMKQHKVTYADA